MKLPIFVLIVAGLPAACFVLARCPSPDKSYHTFPLVEAAGVKPASGLLPFGLLARRISIAPFFYEMEGSAL